MPRNSSRASATTTVVEHAVATACAAYRRRGRRRAARLLVATGPARARGRTGGATRSDSVRAGLAAVPADAAVVVVHDAARPLATTALFAAVIDAVRAGADGAIPVLPIVDTVKRVDGDRIVETVPRDDLVLVQTPQAFRAARLRDAHVARRCRDRRRRAGRSGGRAGGRRRRRAAQHQGHRRRRSRGRTRPTLDDGARCAVRFRVGLGYDIHPFGGDGPLVLGGVHIDGSPPLRGHSDGDAVAHAVADAVLGAAGQPDLGTLYPATDERWRGADSMQLLADIATRVAPRPLVGRQRRRRGRGRGNRSSRRTSRRWRRTCRAALEDGARTDGRSDHGVGETEARRGPRCDRPRRGHRGLGRRLARSVATASRS